MAKLLVVCCLCAVISPAENAEKPNTSKDGVVIMEITKVEVNEATLALSYNIRNGSNREVWVCSEISHLPFEVFLTSDEHILLIRKRLDVPSSAEWHVYPVGTYVPIAPGASLADSVQVALPVSPTFMYASAGTTKVARTVTHLALEIGYYDEDLPALIRGILAVAEKSGLTTSDVPVNLLETYFRGLMVRAVLWDFDRVNKDPYGQGYVCIAYSRQALTGEKILRVDINDVSIPYKGYAGE